MRTWRLQPIVSGNPILSGVLTTAICCLAFPATAFSTCQAGSQQDVKVQFQQGKQVRVTGEYEYQGSVVVIPEDPATNTSKPRKALPLRVTAKVRYTQRMTGLNQAVRYYEGAAANIRLDSGKTMPRLQPENQLVIARLKNKPKMRVEMASIKGTLNQKEFELIRTPADSLSLPNLFTKQNAKIGQTWEPSLDALAKFLNVDQIITSNVKMQLKSAKEGVGRVFVSGGVKADQFDVTTEIKLAGYALINLNKDRVMAVKLNTEEKCPPGQIVPGFEGRTRIDQQFAYDVSAEPLSNKMLAQAMRSSKIQQRLKYEPPQKDYRITYDPRWKLIAGEDESAIMRFIDRGDLLTQCTVVMLPRRAPNQPLKLSKYKAEIQKVIQADDKAQVVKVGQVTTENGLKAMSVVVAGEEEELPVNWVYYHVSDDQGRQMTFVFTLAESVAGRAVGAAKQLVDEFRFLAAPSKVAKETNKVAKRNTNRRTK